MLSSISADPSEIRCDALQALLHKHQAALQALAEKLLEAETLESDDIDAILDTNPPDPNYKDPFQVNMQMHQSCHPASFWPVQ